MKFLFKTSALTATLALLVSALSANEFRIQPVVDDRDVVNEKEVPTTYPNELPPIVPPSAEEEAVSMENSMGFDTDKPFYFTSHPGAMHNVTMVGQRGEFIYLEDGSIWTVCPEDHFIVNTWNQKDSLIIMPNTSWLTGWDFAYKMVNQINGASVAVNLKKYLDVKQHTYVNFSIININHFLRTIRLSDGSEFVVNGPMSYWQPWQTVIIGVNSGSDYNTFPNILINASVNSYVTANCTSMAYILKN